MQSCPRRRRAGRASPPIVPARNEAECIGTSIGSLLAQDYPGALTVILVDDDSDDGTAALARSAAAQSSHRPLTLVASRGVSPGWTGKLWALEAGHRRRRFAAAAARLCAADRRRHRARARLGSRAGGARRERRPCADLADGEAALREPRRAEPCAGLRVLLPDAVSVCVGQCAATVRPRPLPAAACWSRPTRSREAGGVERIRGALIDDCSLARVDEIRRADLARSHRARAQPAPLRDARRRARDDLAIRLCAIELLAGAAGCNHARPGADFSRRSAARVVRDRACAHPRRGRLGADGAFVPADAALLPALAAVGLGAACDRIRLHAIHAQLRASVRARAGRAMEGTRAGATQRRTQHHESDAAQLRSGKGSGDENFPVASWLVEARHRRPILAFYEFVRIADDISDHAHLSPEREACPSRQPRRQPARPQRHQRRGRLRCGRRWPSAISRPSTRRICFGRSART